MRIRLAVPEERTALESLQRRAAELNPGDRALLQANPGSVRLPLEQVSSGHAFVAERDGAIVGFAVLLPRPDGEQELDGLFVEPGCWRQGIGRELVRHCLDVARCRGSGLLYVVGNPHAESFYSSLGFRLTGQVQTEFGPAQALVRMTDDFGTP